MSKIKVMKLEELKDDMIKNPKKFLGKVIAYEVNGRIFTGRVREIGKSGIRVEPIKPILGTVFTSKDESNN